MRKYKTPKGILRAALRLLEKKGWIQSAYEDYYTGAHCLVGAIDAVSGVSLYEEQKVYELLGFSDGGQAINWNDLKSRKFSDVKARIEQALAQ